MFDSFGNTAATLLLLLVVSQLKTILGFINLMKLRLRSSEYVTVKRNQVPVTTLSLLDSAGEALEKMGFVHACYQMQEPFNVFDPRSHEFFALFWHPEKSILVRAELAAATSGQVTKACFSSLFTDGTALQTINRELWGKLPIPEQIHTIDVYADDLAGQWQAHLDALNQEITQRAPITDKDEAIKRDAALGIPCWIARMQQLDWLHEESPGFYQLKPKAAWRYAKQCSNPGAEAKKAFARPYHHDPVPDVYPARLAEMNSIASNIALAAQPFPSWIKWTLFGLTLAFSFVLFKQGLGWIDLVAILAVLLVHELGHLAAMWAFDYRNLSIFFLPLLGAAATGHKPHAPPWQESIVLFSGPLLGLITALAASLIPSDALPMPGTEFVRAFIKFGIIINLFNLLPVGVLDGGRLFELAVLGRFPYARAVFTALGVAAGLAYAASSHSLVFGIAMLILLAGIPVHFKAARAIKAIRAKAKAAGQKKMDKEQVIAALGHLFADGTYGDYGMKGWSQRTAITKLAYPRLLQGIPSLLLSVGVLSTQIISLLAPLVLVIWSLQQGDSVPAMRLTETERAEIHSEITPPQETPESLAEREKFQKTFSKEQDLQKKWTLLTNEQDHFLEEYGYEPTWLTEQRKILFDQLPADHPEKLRETLYRIEPDSNGSAEAVIAIINLATANGTRRAVDLDEERFDTLTAAYETLAQIKKPAGLMAKQLVALNSIWQDLAAANHPLGKYKSRLAWTAAQFSMNIGNREEADLWIERYQLNAGPEDVLAPLTYAWLQLDNGHAGKALELATQAINAPQPSSLISRWQALAGWAEMERGNAREADVYFNAALATRADRIRKNNESTPWWIKLLQLGRNEELLLSGLNTETLDHLAALEAYNHVEADQLRAELAKKLRKNKTQLHASSVLNSYGGLSSTSRKNAHRELLKNLGIQPT